ncbi:hypothetical protein RvY_02720 [Ramazzottius varieornatus]|uniref:Secreted protein n=1 Tax=Ramazzottius varieornatus TaxID=947166 RepID=A0A1D1URH6_RAMVA|nr:hypothetical protein RvY_02720 [Ramazzottius varieornatus]
MGQSTRVWRPSGLVSSFLLSFASCRLLAVVCSFSCCRDGQSVYFQASTIARLTFNGSLGRNPVVYNSAVDSRQLPATVILSATAALAEPPPCHGGRIGSGGLVGAHSGRLGLALVNGLVGLVDTSALAVSSRSGVT